MKNQHGLFTTTLVVVACFGLSNIAKAAQSPSNVNVVNTPNVSVVNTESAPALVRDVDNGVSQPFTVTRTSLVWGDGIFDAPLDMATVPAGKRLVVEQVSVIALTNPGSDQKVFAWIETTNGATLSKYYLTGNDVGTFPNGISQEFIASSLMRSYADAGTTVRVVTRRNSSNGPGRVDVTLSGYLIDSP